MTWLAWALLACATFQTLPGVHSYKLPRRIDWDNPGPYVGIAATCLAVALAVKVVL